VVGFIKGKSAIHHPSPPASSFPVSSDTNIAPLLVMNPMGCLERRP
jgi:predicted transposase YbfD/YdcC